MSLWLALSLIVLAGCIGFGVGYGTRSDRQKAAGPWKLVAEPYGRDGVAFYAYHKKYDRRYPALTAQWRREVSVARVDDLDERIEAQLKAEDRVETLNGLPS